MISDLEDGDRIREELERVLRSETLRHSQQHRVLLSYMVQKSIEHRAEGLKEYSVGIDALGKPESYNPRRDATVRIQVGRLRTRLTEYYRSEGALDPIIFELPKGGFKVVFLNRQEPPALETRALETRAVVPEQTVAAPAGPMRRPWGQWLVGICLGISIALTIVFGLMARSATAKAERITRLSEALWTPELAGIWSSFLEDKRPLTLSLGTPLFVNVDGIMLRDATWNVWREDQLPPRMDSIRRALKATGIQPNYDYNGFGETVGALRISRLLVSRGRDLSFRKSNDLSLDDFKERDMILLGSPKSISYLKYLRDLHTKAAFEVEEKRIVNYEPANGEAASYARADLKRENSYDGYALVTRLPGVDGAGNIMILGSPDTEGTLAACQYVTSAGGAKELMRELAPGGRPLPDAYQALLKVTFRAGVPLTINCIAHRVLKQNAPAGR